MAVLFGFLCVYDFCVTSFFEHGVDQLVDFCCCVLDAFGEVALVLIGDWLVGC